MIAYLSAQFLDVKLFHFWKNLTKGKHLWLRNNASTVGSQLVDTTLVILRSFIGEWSTGTIVLGNHRWLGLLKMLCAFVDTPVFYLTSSYLKKIQFRIKSRSRIIN